MYVGCISGPVSATMATGPCSRTFGDRSVDTCACLSMYHVCTVCMAISIYCRLSVNRTASAASRTRYWYCTVLRVPIVWRVARECVWVGRASCLLFSEFHAQRRARRRSPYNRQARCLANVSAIRTQRCCVCCRSLTRRPCRATPTTTLAVPEQDVI